MNDFIAGMPNVSLTQPSQNAPMQQQPPAPNQGTPSGINPGQPSPENNLGVQPSNAAPSQGTPPVSGQQEQSPLDKFASLYNNAPTPEDHKGNPIPKPKSVLDLSRDDYLKGVEKQDFLKGAVTEEQMTALTKGGEDSVAAMLEVMNTMGRKLYAESMHSATQLSKNALQENSGSMTEAMKTLFKQMNAEADMSDAMPGLNHVAVQPLANVLRSQVIAQNPNMSPKQVNDQVISYFKELGKLAGGDIDPNAPPKDTKEEFDFLKFFNS